MSNRLTTRQDRRGSSYRTPAGLLAGVLLAGALAGCGSPAPELDRDAAKQLQSQVLAVSEAAAANDPAGSLKLLDDLLTRLDAAAANGEVSFKRHQSIKSSIDAVRADLAAQQAAAERAAADKAAAEKAAADQAAAEQAAAAQAAAAAAQPAPAAVAPAPGPAGKAKEKGKGKG
ncbi:mucin-associated surface protein [Arthrobacter sp. H-02-3]|uniref:mucin-associated surface protein n=1 Tax=Arthrobacter sp. H-02-3 TaxID=2703675 RepID=UPI000DD1CFD1|nr:mucin-associated surface protein [Arthrobacter sp. H-02-3]PVZ58884.1 mucin-associated surface protein [Arthrobacter sp. H-02-3]